MMRRLTCWLEARTGWPGAWERAVCALIPGGSRWRYCWITAMAFSFLVQGVTGLFLWTAYAPSTQTAWESVFQIQHELPWGWLLRGLHHFNAQLFLLLVIVQVVTLVWTRLCRPPGEAGFWVLLAILPLAVGMSVTGWMLPFDQNGLWGARVPLNILSVIPGAGPVARELLLGGNEVNHHTLTRFFALHAGLLPVLLGSALLLHLKLTWRRLRLNLGNETQPGEPYWPDQAIKDALVCLGLMAGLVALVWIRGGAPLGAPGDPAETYPAARPEWLFLFLFELLKHFPGGTEIWGAVVIPSAVFALLGLSPWLAAREWGRKFNQVVLLLVGAAVVGLTVLAIRQDAQDPGHQAAIKAARQKADRTLALARAARGIPPEGGLALLQNDPLTRGPQLFARHCASCHRYGGTDGLGNLVVDPASAADLKGFASRAWLEGLMDPRRVSGPDYFGGTRFKDGKMARFVRGHLAELPAEGRAQLRQALNALSAEAGLPSQQAVEAGETKALEAGRNLLATPELRCTECHKFREHEDEPSGPDLTGYGSETWLVAFISDPAQPRFYGNRNDRMPAFGRDGILGSQEIRLLAAWLRGDYVAAARP